MELYRKYRPKRFKDVIGQNTAISVLEPKIKKKKLPHVILFSGPSGCGKTTLARICSKKIGCHTNDLIEINAAENRGIDLTRTIKMKMGLQGLYGGSRVWIIDECHMLTTEAKNSMLKMLEDMPDHVYFFLCTTEPGKVIKTTKTRCLPINLKALSDDDCLIAMQRICKKEKIKPKDKVLNKIIELSDGSARKCIVLLEAIMDIPKSKDQLEALVKASSEIEAIMVCRKLFSKTNWKEMSKVIKGLETTDWEGLRWMILSYATTILLSGGYMADKAFKVIEIFRDNWYDCKKSGLVASCYEVITGGS